MDFNNLHNVFYVYATDYYIWSFDLHIINFLINEVESDNYMFTKEAFKEIVDSIVNNNKSLLLFSNTFVDKYKKKCMYYGSTIIGKDKSSLLKMMLKEEYYKTWDNFSLSCIYLNFIQHAFKNKFPESEFLIKLSQLLCVNISPDPEDRFTIEETISRANSILKKLEKSHSNEQLNKEIKTIKDDIQLEFFKLDDPALEEIKGELLDIDINSMTPMDALLKLSEIKRKITDSQD